MRIDDERPPDAPPATEGQPAVPGQASDRRRFPRIQLALTVALRFPSAEAALESSTVDISEGGVFIRMPNPRPEGTAIRVQLRVGERVLEIGGVVVRCMRPSDGEPSGIGVLFTELHPDDATFVRTLVRERLSTPALSE
jgi:uncharacterized protein (TIGR02266 family)